MRNPHEKLSKRTVVQRHRAPGVHPRRNNVGCKCLLAAISRAYALPDHPERKVTLFVDNDQAHKAKVAISAMEVWAMNTRFDEDLIAPCGMNCGLCSNYLARRVDLRKEGIRRGYCVGCRPCGENCRRAKGNCDLLAEGQVEYCYECKEFPCDWLTRLDNLYRAKYHLSMIENQEYIKENGIKEFLVKEKRKWSCTECDGVICCHDGICYDCGLEKLHITGGRAGWSKLSVEPPTDQ